MLDEYNPLAKLDIAQSITSKAPKVSKKPL